MKLIIFLVGLVISLWVSVLVYSPVQSFVVDIQKVYLQSKAIQRTVVQKSGNTVNTITDAYKEIARVFGVEVAEESAKEEISTPTPAGDRDPIEQLFEHNIALWIAAGAGFMTFSLYLNILSIFAFFLKPITFFVK
ncbi:hypothetical protein KA071_03295 [Candidatus Gracilibacteria bacterium]|jgi:hypothetical protein|nr:hypothetical protein [Candidatus Gracilibacteria bacterium]